MQSCAKHFYDFGPYRLNSTDRCLFRSGTLVELTPKEFETLLALVEKSKLVVERQELKARIWPDTAVEENNLAQQIRALRGKLIEPEGASPYIKTISRRGYCFSAEVKEIWEPDHRQNVSTEDFTAEGHSISLLKERGPDANSSSDQGPCCDTPSATGEGSAAPAESMVSHKDVEGRPFLTLGPPEDVPHSTGVSNVQRQAPPYPIARSGEDKARPRRRLRLKQGLLAACAIAVLVAASLFLIRLDKLPQVLQIRQITHDGHPKSGPLLTDGSRIYFGENGASGWSLAVALQDGRVMRLNPPIAGPPLLLDVDRHSGELLIRVGASLWRWLPGSQSAQQVPNTIPGDAAIYVGGGQGLTHDLGRLEWFNLSDGVTTRRITLPLSALQSVEWMRRSPDGGKICLGIVDKKREARSAWEIGEDGSNPHMFMMDRQVHSGNWAANGRWFVLTETRRFDRGYGELQVITRAAMDLPSADVRSAKPVHGLGGLPSGAMRWGFPVDTGQSLLAIGENRRVEAVRLDLGSRLLAPLLDGVAAIDLDYSRDGHWIAYVDEFDKTVWKIRADGSQKTQITFPPLDCDSVHWSPNGGQIAFMGRRPGGHWQSDIISADGGLAEPAHPDTIEQGVPTWSPDGRFVVYGERRDQQPAEQMKLHLVDLSTHHMTDLPDSAAKWTARWSPDGRYILAQSLDWHDLYLFNTVDGQWRQIGHYQVADQLRWSPDSRYVYFEETLANGIRSLCRLKVGGGSPEKLAELSAISNGEVRFIGLMPDGSPVLSRDVATQEIYRLDIEWP